LGFLRIGFGRRVSLGIGPVTFYGAGRKRRAPGCKRCGKRTPYKVCVTCQKEFKAIVNETAPVFEGYLRSEATSRDILIRKKSHKEARKALKTLKTCASYGVEWNNLSEAKNDYLYVHSLTQLYSDYLRITAHPPKNEIRLNAKIEKVRRKYDRVLSRLKMIKAVQIEELFNPHDKYSNTKQDESSPIVTPESTDSNLTNIDVLSKLTDMLKECLPLARASHLAYDTRCKAYDTALEMINMMIQSNTDTDLYKSLREYEVLVREERETLYRANHSKTTASAKKVTP